VLLQDVGGEEKLRPYWRHYYTGTQGVLFVLDASDRERLPLATLELKSLAQDEQLAVSARDAWGGVAFAFDSTLSTGTSCLAGCVHRGAAE